MKSIIVLYVCFLLIGCSLIPPKYDNNEYYILARLETHSRFLKDECLSPNKVKNRLATMIFDAKLLNSYAFFLPRNSEVFEISKILEQDVTEMIARYKQQPPSSTYCKLKAAIFTKKARRALQSIGNLQSIESYQ